MNVTAAIAGVGEDDGGGFGLGRSGGFGRRGRQRRARGGAAWSGGCSGGVGGGRRRRGRRLRLPAAVRSDGGGAGSGGLGSEGNGTGARLLRGGARRWRGEGGRGGRRRHGVHGGVREAESRSGLGDERRGPAGPWPGELGRPGPVGPEEFFFNSARKIKKNLK